MAADVRRSKPYRSGRHSHRRERTFSEVLGFAQSRTGGLFAHAQVRRGNGSSKLAIFI
jgi:hypothetical protein